MSMQYILNNCLNFDINYRRVVNQMLSRSGRLYVSEYPTAQPFRINITMHNYLFYPQVRSVIQVLDNEDKNTEEIITFNGVGGDVLNYTSYQGQLTPAQLASITISAYAGNTMTLSNLPAISGTVTATTVILMAGDFIQPVGHRYPYKVRANVLRGSTSTVTVQVHRPIIGSIMANANIVVGSAITLPVIALSMPAYQINPMSFVEWEGDFQLIENITG